MNITKRMAELFALDAKIEAQKSKLSDLNEKMERIEQQTIEWMEANNMATVKGSDGRQMIVMPPRLFASVKKENRDMAFAWLKDKGFDYAIQPSVHHGTLSTIIKDRISNGNSFPDDCFSYYHKKSLSLRPSTK